MPDQNRTVYSTEWGRMCPKCGKPINDCVCKSPRKISGDGVVRLERQSKGRKGKPVTLIRGVTLADDELKLLLRELKQICGSGGTLKDDVLEIQGDHRDRLAEILKKKGFKIKIVGG
ncbi:MAG: translation initiation factor Sui1 [Anaerolineaceae bacterium]|nr:translation initiation factor Sui1 [Anaerolineaceae bacterium]